MYVFFLRILLDCGIHPGLQGMEALPYVDMIEAHKIDLLLVSHFHLDHAGALPWFLMKTTFRGKVFMTHATKAIYRWLLSDFIKVSNIATEQMLYTEQDLETSMDKIETINFHEEKEINGIKFWAYNAGHVLGAAMFMIEIAGVRVLYTGDFSREEDRHLMAAELPSLRPDVLIVESTYGTHIHEKREDRELRFTSTIHDIVSRGGRCLIPVFALGRAQELLLILDEYWAAHPELHEVPIYYASSLAKKCMAVYQTFVNAMNEKIRRQIAVNNPFVFKHISNLKGIDSFDDIGPCVVLASPGMMQSGLSRDLFESWCGDAKNGCIVAGYCVEGTLAKHILSEPEEISTLNGQKLPLKAQVSYISFSAHTDYKQTSGFIRALKPPHVVLVHGEANEMNRLKSALVREYEADQETKMTFHNPRNTVAVELLFRGEKMAKVVGSLAVDKPVEGHRVSGILVKRNFNYHLLNPEDLPKYTDMTISTVTQKQSVYYSGSFQLLQFLLSQITADCETIKTEADKNKGVAHIRAFNGALAITCEKRMVTLEFQSNPINDMLADAVMSVVLQAESIESPRIVPSASVLIQDSVSREKDFQVCLIEMLQDMFGEQNVKVSSDGETFEKVEKIDKAKKIRITVDSKKSTPSVATIELPSIQVECNEDPLFKQIVHTACMKLRHSLVPPMVEG